MKRAQFWASVPAIILVGLIGTQVIVLSRVLSDPSFAVEEDYYQKAVEWDERQAVQRAAEELGFDFEVTLSRLDPPGRLPEARVELAVVSPTAAELSVSAARVVAFHNARAGLRLRAEMQPLEPGRFRAVLPMRRPGLWELRFEVDTLAGTLRHSERRDWFAGPLHGESGQLGLGPGALR